MEWTYSEGKKKQREKRRQKNADPFAESPPMTPPPETAPKPSMDAIKPCISLPLLRDMQRNALINKECYGPFGRPWPRGVKTNSIHSQADTAAFVERQYGHKLTEARMQISLEHRQWLHDIKVRDQAFYVGGSGREGFRIALEEKFGSVLAGWRSIDVEKKGKVTFNEFCRACRGMAFHGNLKKLWTELDTRKYGYITLMDVDPVIGDCVGRFKLQMISKFGDMPTAWLQGMDANRNGRVEMDEFVSFCKAQALNLGDVEPEVLFEALLSGPRSQGLSLGMFDPEAAIQVRLGKGRGKIPLS
mmetsp:Transcript_5587/g.13968  ORF Transcript_5587/g.13968 Transcript_5587/m.13968 type:complete len:302 (-) Transcript_5587:91-996(-)